MVSPVHPLGLKKLIARLVAGVFALFFVGTGALVVFGLNDRLAPSDVALVLGNKVELDGKPSVRLQARLDRTLELYRSGYFPEIIVSGGVGREGFDEGLVMRDYLVANGVPSEHIMVDSRGDTTFASARNTAEIVRQHHFRSVLVVSQYFHIARSYLALSRFGVSQVNHAHAHFFEWRDFYSAPRELIGYLSYRWRRYEIPTSV
jgi:vancomycin permeability regulator SanA